MADRPEFDIPIDCTIGETCMVRLYFDHDPGPDATDYACGTLVYDGHGGTDFGTITLERMWQGVAVLATADGVVIGTRSSMEDVSVAEIGVEALDGNKAGNSVRIDHGDGWFTQYAHMMQGSILVEVGDQVVAGQPLGLVGLSGNTTFPHLHFSVSRDDRKLDPFVGEAQGFACGSERDPLWSPDALAVLAYQAGGVLQSGFAPEAADLEKAS